MIPILQELAGSAKARFEERSPEHGAPSVAADNRSWPCSTVCGLVLAAFFVRMAFLLALGTYRFDRIDDTSSFGEVVRISQSIAKGWGFSSPFTDEYTGPTAWIAPVYPYFLALVFRCLGVMTQSACIFIFTVQSLLSALTIIPILGIARLTVGRRAGLLAAGIWALFPWFSKWSVTWIWEISLSALLFSLLFWHALYLQRVWTRKAWIGFGALWGFALLVNPALCTLLPLSLAWIGYKQQYLRKQDWLKPVAVSLLTCLTVISPWLVRNRLVFGHWVFLRGNFGFEFALGNYHLSFGRGWKGKHPASNPAEYTQYREMGEAAYVRSKDEQAIQFVHDYPREFITLTAKRVLYFWDGSAMGYRPRIAWYWVPFSFAVLSFLLLPALLVARWQNLRAWQMFYGALLLYPLPYYLTYSQVRYRHVLEPIILLLVAYAGLQTMSRLSAISRRAA